jgi:hypothetical protein
MISILSSLPAKYDDTVFSLASPQSVRFYI